MTTWPSGAIEAIKEAGKIPGKDIVIISFDAVKAAFEAMVRGELNVSVECNPLHGPRVAEVIKEIMAGKKVEKLQYVEEGSFRQRRRPRSFKQKLLRSPNLDKFHVKTTSCKDVHTSCKIGYRNSTTIQIT